MGTALLVALVVILISGGAPPGGRSILLGVVLGVLAIAMFLFHSLTVEVTADRLRLAFGPGWIRRNFAVAEIADAERVRNHWYYGWGIRFTPHGWLYNVSGLDAVQVRMRGGKRFRIGTDDPERLVAAIRGAAGLDC